MAGGTEINRDPDHLLWEKCRNTRSFLVMCEIFAELTVCEVENAATHTVKSKLLRLVRVVEQMLEEIVDR